jgi:hypothetical protein
VITAAYSTMMMICSSSMFIFGFFVGRCARKIPILDENLPRVLYRREIGPETENFAKLDDIEEQAAKRRDFDTA